MTLNILLSAHNKHHERWLPALRSNLAQYNLEVCVETSCDNPESVDYIIHSPDGDISNFSTFVNLRAILSLWAGVEDIVHNKSINVPLVRMVDPGMIEGMTEWVTGQVLRHHLGFDAHIFNRQGTWLKELSPPLARQRVVGILGLGVLGTSCAKILSQLNFQVLGWSRILKKVENIQCYCGKTGLIEVLKHVDILALLLPLTPYTKNVMNDETLSCLKPGAVIINSGRGGLIDDNALLAAIEKGVVAHATLDVFRKEPLPYNHPFWSNSRISIWPHIASETRVATASKVIAKNIWRDYSGKNMHNIVNISNGY